MQHIDILNFMQLLNNDLKLYIINLYTQLWLTDLKGMLVTEKNYSTKRHKSYSKKLGAIYQLAHIIALQFYGIAHNKLNLDRTKLKSYSNIIKYLEGYKGDKLFTNAYISKLRHKGEFKKVPLTSESLESQPCYARTRQYFISWDN